MTTQSDHLIERAAARLRGNSSGAGPAGAAPPPVASVHAAPTGSASPDDGAAGTPHPAGSLVAEAPAQYASQASLPALPTLPPDIALATLEQAGLVVGRSTRTRISEEFRIAVGRIARMAEIAPVSGTVRPVILVTSAKPGEGKTFTSLNLAAVLAQNGPRRVVLVDTDFKQESLTELLGASGRRGLVDLSQPDAANPRSFLLTTEIPRLAFLPGGMIVQEDIGGSFKSPLGPRVAAAAAAFPDEIVVLDAPPCLSTSDPSTLAEQASQVLLVVEAGRTQRAEVEAALDFIRACPTVNILLNKVQQSSRQTFGSYDYLSSYQ